MIPYSLSKIDSTGRTNSLSSTTNTEKISIVTLKIYNYVVLIGKEKKLWINVSMEIKNYSFIVQNGKRKNYLNFCKFIYSCPVHLLICISVLLTVCLSIWLSFNLFVNQSVYLPVIYLLPCLSACLYICLALQPVFLSIYLSICVNVWLSLVYPNAFFYMSGIHMSSTLVSFS